MQAEIEKVQRRREEREAEKIRSEEELQFIQRERAVAEGLQLDKKEELVPLPPPAPPLLPSLPPSRFVPGH